MHDVLHRVASPLIGVSHGVGRMGKDHAYVHNSVERRKETQRSLFRLQTWSSLVMGGKTETFISVAKKTEKKRLNNASGIWLYLAMLVAGLI